MYHLITGLYAEWTKKARYNVLLVGPSGVGKSCLLEKIKSLYLKRPPLPPNKIAPTVGQNVLELTLPTMHLHFWDLGGSPSVRTLWSKYYEESDAVVWVVDARHFVALHTQRQAQRQQQQHDAKGKAKASAPDLDFGTEAFDVRQSSWKLLAELLTHPNLEGRPLLIIANKSDECDAIPTDLIQTIKDWFADKLARIDEDPEPTAAADASQSANVFADDDGDPAYRPPASGARLTLDEREYEWHVLLASAIDGTGVHDAVDWLSVRVQGSRNGRTR